MGRVSQFFGYHTVSDMWKDSGDVVKVVNDLAAHHNALKEHNKALKIKLANLEHENDRLNKEVLKLKQMMVVK